MEERKSGSYIAPRTIARMASWESAGSSGQASITSAREAGMGTDSPERDTKVATVSAPSPFSPCILRLFESSYAHLGGCSKLQSLPTPPFSGFFHALGECLASYCHPLPTTNTSEFAACFAQAPNCEGVRMSSIPFDINVEGTHETALSIESRESPGTARW